MRALRQEPYSYFTLDHTREVSAGWRRWMRAEPLDRESVDDAALELAERSADARKRDAY